MGSKDLAFPVASASDLPWLMVPNGFQPVMLPTHMSIPPRKTPPISPYFDQRGLTLRTGLRSRAIGPSVWMYVSYALSSSPERPSAMAAAAASAASIPESIALWLPLIRGTFTRPTPQPRIATPGATALGIDCQPPSEMARAP